MFKSETFLSECASYQSHLFHLNSFFNSSSSRFIFKANVHFIQQHKKKILPFFRCQILTIVYSPTSVRPATVPVPHFSLSSTNTSSSSPSSQTLAAYIISQTSFVDVPVSYINSIAYETSSKHSIYSMSHLRYGVFGLKAGFLRQDSRPLAFLPVKPNRYARLEGTLLSLAKGTNGEVIWSFDIAGSHVVSNRDDRKITIFIFDSQRRKRRVMTLIAHNDKNYLQWSSWLSKASMSVLEMHYTMDRLISKGAFARVVLGKDIHTNQLVAIKLIEKSNAPPSERKYFEREMKIMQNLSNPNIVQCYDVFDNRLRTRIVMEYIQGGTLGDLISNRKTPLPESIAKQLMKDILSGVEYLHDMGVIHRDLKPDNCLLTNSDYPYGPVKLSDFGLSNVISKTSPVAGGTYEANDLFTSAVGSPGFIAPEIFESKYGTSVDIWSCGVILYMILSGGIMPFPGKSPSEIVTNAKQGDINFASKGLENTSDLAKSLVTALLNVDGNERVTAREALDHPWFSNQNQASASQHKTSIHPVD